MAGVEVRAVAADEAGLRVDRWFRRHFPDVTHARLQKWLRTGQVRVDGHRTAANTRLEAGQQIRVPPHEADAGARPPQPALAPTLDPADIRAMEMRVLHRDGAVLVLDKPPGLAVQGGTGTHRHLDAMLDGLRFGGARPRLVHRLDRDTSGVLVLARTATAAARLAAAFRSREAEKLYWALVVGVPEYEGGRIDLPLAKRRGPGGERMEPADDDDAQRAVTEFAVVERAGREAAWLALEPRTGRTHQLRAHCLALGTPILGDGKYGGAAAFPGGKRAGIRLHLHARRLVLPHPEGGLLSVEAPLPEHMRATWAWFGFTEPKAARPERLHAGAGKAAPKHS